MYGRERRNALNIPHRMMYSGLMPSHAKKNYTKGANGKEEEQFSYTLMLNQFLCTFSSCSSSAMGAKRSQPSANGRENEERKQQTVNILY